MHPLFQRAGGDFQTRTVHRRPRVLPETVAKLRQNFVLCVPQLRNASFVLSRFCPASMTEFLRLRSSIANCSSSVSISDSDVAFALRSH